jgi:hypothetical protein
MRSGYREADGEAGMENRWAEGTCLGSITGTLVLPLAVTICLICTGDVLFLCYESYALPALALQGGILGLVVSPFVLVLLGNKTAPVTVARIGGAAALGAVTAIHIAVTLLVLLAWSTGAIPDLPSREDIGVLLVPCLAGVVGFAVGGAVAVRERHAYRTTARLQVELPIWHSHWGGKLLAQDSPISQHIQTRNGIVGPGAPANRPFDRSA